jgi:hypothetical protein
VPVAPNAETAPADTNRAATANRVAEYFIFSCTAQFRDWREIYRGELPPV